MPADQEFAAHLTDLLQSIGPVESKRMFGGYGFFLDGLMFGLLADNSLYLKVDDHSKADFEQQGLEPFTYNKNGRQVKMSYYQAPEESIEDMQLLSEWANKAYAAALRSKK